MTASMYCSGIQGHAAAPALPQIIAIVAAPTFGRDRPRVAVLGELLTAENASDFGRGFLRFFSVSVMNPQT